MILVAGPYRSGTNEDPALIAKNVAQMTEVSLQLFRAGHLPVFPGDMTPAERDHPMPQLVLSKQNA